MRPLIFLLFFTLNFTVISAQNQTKTVKSELHSENQNIFIKIDNSTSDNWLRNDQDVNSSSNIQTTANGNISFSTTNKGVYISIINGVNQIKLYALTGQLLLNGNLSQGRFFIPTRYGIYLLRINNESFKIVCK